MSFALPEPIFTAVIRSGDPSPSAVGRLLKHWRSVRRMSQLDVALRADVSTRHLSFVETGRSNPSREMVLLLCEVLDVPLRERNALLEAAGYAAAYRETGLSEPELDQVRSVVRFMLESHLPYSAVAIDREWNVLMANRAHERLLDAVLDDDVEDRIRSNLLRLVFDPRGVRPAIENWDEVARAVLDRVHREVRGHRDDEAGALLEEILGYPDVPERWSVPDLTRRPPMVIPIRLRAGDAVLSLFTAITTLGTPQDVTLQELRIESFFPADEATERAIRALAVADGRG